MSPALAQTVTSGPIWRVWPFEGHGRAAEDLTANELRRALFLEAAAERGRPQEVPVIGADDERRGVAGRAAAREGLGVAGGDPGREGEGGGGHRTILLQQDDAGAGANVVEGGAGWGHHAGSEQRPRRAALAEGEGEIDVELDALEELKAHQRVEDHLMIDPVERLGATRGGVEHERVSGVGPREPESGAEMARNTCGGNRKKRVCGRRRLEAVERRSGLSGGPAGRGDTAKPG